jgi:hypothetical protein
VGASDAALPGFFNDLVIGGYVEASYIYNFENPDAHIGTQGTYQFNNEHDSFQLNAVKLELGKPASDPGTAGFQFDLLFGDNAAVLNNGLAAFYDDDGGSLFGDDQFFIQQAYVSYNWNGVVFDFGKFVTTRTSRTASSSSVRSRCSTRASSPAATSEKRAWGGSSAS